MKKVVLHIAAVLLLLVVGAAVGYYVGVKTGFQNGLSASSGLVNPLDKSSTVYSNPFKYQNPFDKIKVNPFDK